MNLLFKITYGLYLVCATDGKKDNACISNTLLQQTSNPERFSLTLNKANLTTELVLKSKKCAVGVIGESAPFELFKDFGMRSGKDCDKFASKAYEKAQNGVKVPTDDLFGYFEFDVQDSIDLGTHYQFILASTAVKTFEKDGNPVSYAYYQANIKPKPAPIVQDDREVWVCKVCGYVHKGPLPKDFVCPICKHGAADFERQTSQKVENTNKNIDIQKGETTMTKWICPVCGYVHEGPNPPEFCPQCKVPGSKFKKQDDGEMTWAAEHVIGVGKNVPEDIKAGLKANFEGECTEVGMYLAMSRAAHREGYPEIGLYWEKAALEEAEHAAKFCEMLGDLVSPSTKENLTVRVAAENGATAGKFELAKRAKEEGLDAIHDTVHEMARDEARHGRAFKGLLDRYFK